MNDSSTHVASRIKLPKKTRQAAARLMGGPPATDNYNDLDPDSIQIYVPSLEQRMRERQDK